MEKDQNINSENQNNEPKEVKHEDQDNEVEKNTSKKTMK